MSRNLKLQNWLKSEVEKDKKEVDQDKQKLIRELTSLKKEELFKQKKYSFWERIKKILF